MLSKSLTEYIDLHYSLGFKFRTQRLLLRNFVSFAEAHRSSVILPGVRRLRFGSSIRFTHAMAKQSL